MRYSALLSLLLLLIISFPASAQSDSTMLFEQDAPYSLHPDSTISFIAYWQKGDSRHYKVTKKSIQYTNDSLKTNETQSYIINLKVLDATPASYLLEWRSEVTLIPGKSISEELKPVLEKYKHLTIKYRTDEYGTFQQIENYKEIRKMMRKMFAKVTAKDKQLGKALKPMIETYTSRVGVERALLKEIQYFHYPMGIQINYHDTIRYEDELPNMFGGDPIQGDSRVYFTSVDTASQTCEFVNHLTMNQAEARKMIIDAVERIAATLDHPSEAEKQRKQAEMRELFNSMDIDMYDLNRFKYDYALGWPEFLNCTRTIKTRSKDVKVMRQESLEIELVTN